ncbi:TPA: hypothetical protein VKN21_001640 [Streptococcus pyogenes NGAS719]|nr:hypothetical protein [Streptococcus pyogenes NGAS719]
MKIRSKRFLNLAPLCLALLSTTLLTTQPVKANDESSVQSRRESLKKGKNYDYNDYDKEWKKGYAQGYIDGQGEGASRYPDSNRYGSNSDSDPYDGYRDGYDEGYAAGWYKKHGFDKSEGEESDDPSQDSRGHQGSVESGSQQEDNGTDAKNKNSQEGEESDDPSQGDRGHQGSVESSTQQEDTDMISPIVQTVLQAVLGVLSSFLNWFEAI